MATSKAITPSNIHGWLASLGYLFPTTEGEVTRFERLYADMAIPEEELLDPEVILGNRSRQRVLRIGTNNEESNFGTLKMAARNKGKAGIPDHIFQKMKNKHKKPDNTNDGSPEEKAD